MADRMRVIVNAVPLMNVRTGIGRYLACLYGAMERRFGDRAEFSYFDGRTVSRDMPSGPGDLSRWSGMVDLFWKLPAPLALAVRLAHHWRSERAFRRAARGFDLYHEAGFFPFRAPAGVRTAFTLHDLSVFRFPEHHPRERVLYFKVFFRRRLRLARAVITVSRFTADEMRRVLGPESARDATAVPLACDTAVFHPRTPDQAARARERFGLPERYFLFVGSGDPRKNLDIVPEALKKADLDEPLAVVGWSGWRQGGQWSNARALGYVDDEDLAGLYSGALGLVLPSAYEGFGLPLLEAMSCGCPVITARAASLPEVAGEAALYLDHPRDRDGLAVLLGRLAADESLRASLRGQGFARAREFSWGRTAEATFEVFERVLASHD